MQVGGAASRDGLAVAAWIVVVVLVSPSAIVVDDAVRHARGTRARAYALTGLAIGLAWLWLTAPWWFYGLSTPFDSHDHFYPTLRWLARHLAAGDWPTWMPEIYGGRPALADPQSLIAQPAFLLLAWLDPTPSLRAMDVMVLAHLLLGALVLAVRGLRTDAHPLACVLAALVFAFGGAAMARLQHPLMVMSYAWLPVVMLAVEMLLERPRWRNGLLTGAAVAVLTVNRDHAALHGHFVVAGTTLARLAGSPTPFTMLRRALPAIGLALLVWLVLIALPIAASLAFVDQSNRPGFDLEITRRLSLPWASLLTMPFPDLFRTVSDYQSYWGPPAPGWPEFWFDYAVVQLAPGIVPTALVLWLGVLRGWLFAPGARLGAVIAIVALAFMVGERLPLFPLLHERVPGLDLFQRPADASFILNLGLTLALLGIVDRYLRQGLAPVARWRHVAEVALLLVPVACAVGVAVSFDKLATDWRAIAIPTLVAALAIVMLRVGAQGDPRRRLVAVALLVAATIADFSVHNAGIPINAGSAEAAAPLEHPDEDPLMSWLMAEAERGDGAGPPRLELLGLGRVWQNAGLAHGFHETLGYNPLRNGRYDTATGARQNSDFNFRLFGTLMTGYASPFNDVLGARHIVLGAPMAEIDPTSAPAFGQPRRIGDAYVYANPDAAPRLVLVAAENVQPHDPDALLQTGDLPPFDPWHEALIEGAETAVAPPGTGAFDGSLQVVDYGPDRIRLVVRTDRPAWLVFHDVADPGWAAIVDGKQRPLHRANVLFQAVAVEPGDQEVVFDYAPWRAIREHFLR